jgi:hypothetical protein
LIWGELVDLSRAFPSLHHGISPFWDLWHAKVALPPEAGATLPPEAGATLPPEAGATFRPRRALPYRPRRALPSARGGRYLPPEAGATFRPRRALPSARGGRYLTARGCHAPSGATFVIRRGRCAGKRDCSSVSHLKQTAPMRIQPSDRS